MPGLYYSTWHGLWAPKGTPADIVAKINAAANAAMADAEVRKRIAALGMDLPPQGSGDARGVRGIPQGRSREMVSDRQGGGRQAGVKSTARTGEGRYEKVGGCFARRWLVARSRAGADLSVAAGHLDRAVSRGRAVRHAGARAGRGDARPARPDRHHRERGGRRRQHRHRARRALGAGWLHAQPRSRADPRASTARRRTSTTTW